MDNLFILIADFLECLSLNITNVHKQFYGESIDSSAETIQCPFQNMNATLIFISVLKSTKLITDYKIIHFQENLHILGLNKQFLYGTLEL